MTATVERDDNRKCQVCGGPGTHRVRIIPNDDTTPSWLMGALLCERHASGLAASINRQAELRS